MQSTTDCSTVVCQPPHNLKRILNWTLVSRASVQTGSGKTYTMLGDQVGVGIVTMALMDTFAELERRAGEARFRVTATLVEIYNEQLVDLFAVADGQLLPERLGIVVRLANNCPEHRHLCIEHSCQRC